MPPELVAFLEALMSSGSVAILTNQRYSGQGGTPLPFSVMGTVTTGNPWGYTWTAKMLRPHHLALRRVCFRLLARMAFLSAERALGHGPVHLSRDQPWYQGCGHIWEGLLAHRRNQGAILQVVYLMIFLYQRFPWGYRRQYHAYGTWRQACYWDVDPNKAMRSILVVPGVLQALAVRNNL